MEKRLPLAVVVGMGLAALGTVLTFGEESDSSGKAIAIQSLGSDQKVKFQKDVIPILKDHCLACHSRSKAKGGLVLETPGEIKQGGDTGPAVKPKKPGESLLLAVASRRKKPYMPPKDNDAGAKPLTPKELGVIEKWIKQGATGKAVMALPEPEWEPLPPKYRPILDVAMTSDGEYAAAARGNRIHSYHLPSKRMTGRVRDPSLEKPFTHAAHRGTVHALAVSSDGQWLASGGYRTIKLWKRDYQARRFQVKLPPRPARPAVALGGGGRWLAVSDRSGRIRLWDVKSGKAAATLSGHSGPVSSISFDGSRLVSAGDDGTLRFWDAKGGKARHTIETDWPITAVAHLGDRVATGGPDQKLRLWRLPGQDEEKLAGLSSPARAVDVDRKRQRLAVAEKNGKVRVLDAGSGKTRVTVDAGGSVTSVSLSGKRLAVGSKKGWVRIYGTKQGKRQATLWAGAAVTDVALRPSGKDLAVAAGRRPAVFDLQRLGTTNKKKLDLSVKGVARGAWAVARGKADGKPALVVYQTKSGQPKHRVKGVDAGALALSRNGQSFAAATPKQVLLFETGSGKRRAAFQVKAKKLAVAANGKRLAAATGKKVVVRQAGKKKPVATFKLGGSPAELAFLSNGRLVVAVGKELRWLDPAAGKQRRKQSLAAPAVSLRVSADGRRLAVALDNGVVKAMKAGGDGLGQWKLENPAKTLAFRKKRLLAASAGRTRVWDLSGERPTEHFRTSKPVRAAAWLPDGRRALLATADGSGRLVSLAGKHRLGKQWSAEVRLAYHPKGNRTYAASAAGKVRAFDASGSKKFETDHGGRLRALAVGPKGRFLATAGDDKRVRLWHAGNGSPVGPKVLGGFGSPVEAVAFGPGGQRLLAATEAGDLRAFNLKKGRLLRTFSAPGGLVGVAVVDGKKGRRFLSVGPAVHARPLGVKSLTKHGGAITVIKPVDGGKRLITGARDNRARLIRTKDGKTLQQYGHSGSVVDVAVSPGSKRLVVVGDNRRARVYNLGNSNRIAKLRTIAPARRKKRRENNAFQFRKREINYHQNQVKQAKKAIDNERSAIQEARKAIPDALKGLRNRRKKYRQRVAQRKKRADRVEDVKRKRDAAKRRRSLATTALGWEKPADAVSTAKQAKKRGVADRAEAKKRLQKAKARVEAAAKALKKAKKAKPATVKKAKKRKKEAEKARQQARKKLKKVRKKHDKALEAYQKAKRRHAAAVTKAERKKKAAEAAVERARAAVEKAQAHRKRAKKWSEGVSDDATRVRQRRAKRLKGLAKQRLQRRQSRLESAEKRLKQAKKGLEQAKDDPKLEKARAKWKQAKKKLEKARQAYKEARGAADKAVRALAEARAGKDLWAAKTEHSEAKRAVANAKQTRNLADARVQVANHALALAKATAGLERAKAERAKAAKAAEQAKKELSEAKQKAKAAAKALQKAKGSGKKKKVQEATKAKKQADEAVKAAEKAVKRAKRRLKEAKQAVKQAKQKQKKATDRVRGDRDDAKKAIDQAKKQLDNRKDNLGAKKRQEAQAQQAYKVAQRNVDSARKRVEAARERLREQKKALRQRRGAYLEAVKERAEAAVDRQLANRATNQADRRVRSATLAAGGSVVLLGTPGGRAYTFSAKDGRAAGTLELGKGAVIAMATNDAGRLVSVSRSGTVRVGRVHPRWKLAKTIQPEKPTKPPLYRVTALDFSRDNKWLVSGGGIPSRRGEVVLWNVPDGKMVRQFKGAHSDTVLDVQFWDRGRRFTTASADQFVKVFDPKTGKELKAFEGHTNHALSVDWHRSGRELASAGAGRVVLTWNWVTGERKRKAGGFNRQVTMLRYLGYQDRAATTVATGHIRFIRNGRRRRRYGVPGSDFLHALAVSRSGRWLVAGGQKGVLYYWDTKKNNRIAEFERPQPARTAKAKQ